ncbi:hypothetical protein BGZ91_005998 [Linnemannia elongata]|nr:hypothetical protein BGZ91_005998 [Linnemannia elongata]
MEIPVSSRAKPDHIAWALDKKKGEEHVTFQTFVKKFGYTDRTSAVASYTLLLQASQIERQRSKRLVEGFTEFQDNSSELFWSEVESKVDTIVTARRAGTITRAAGLKQIADDFGNYLGLVAPPVSESSSASSLPSLNVIGAAGQKHPRDPVDELAEASPNTPRNRFPTKHPGDPFDRALQETPRNRVSLGGALAPENPPVADDFYSTPGSTPPIYSSRQYLGTDLLSTDPADLNFVDIEDLKLSTSRLYTWDFLDGPGRLNSDVDNFWVCNGIEVGGDLMACRRRIVENNGGLTEPYEMLVVNFAFLVEAEYQTGGLQGEVEDETWDAICETVRDPVLPLSNEAVIEAHQWAHRLAQTKSEAFAQLLDDSPPQNRTLKSILTKMADTAQLWSTRSRNEDTTPVQDETRGPESSLLIPDYALTTQVGKQQVSVLLLEGKIARNTGQGQIWDDLTKLGQEMKAALDSIVKLQPEGDITVIGVLVREPLIEFYTMRIHAEATYIMHRFASTYIAPEAINVFPLVHMMEIFEHIQGKVQQTVTQIRQVKVHPSPNPKVPLSWLRPSFKKPRRFQILDGH